MPIFNISKKKKKKKRVKFSILGLQKGRGFTKKKKGNMLKLNMCLVCYSKKTWFSCEKKKKHSSSSSLFDT